MRRIGQLGLVEQGLVVVDEAGEERERDTDQHALVLGKVEQGRVVAGQVEVGGLRQRADIRPGALESGAAALPTGPTMSGPAPARELWAFRVSV